MVFSSALKLWHSNVEEVSPEGGYYSSRLRRKGGSTTRPNPILTGRKPWDTPDACWSTVVSARSESSSESVSSRRMRICTRYLSGISANLTAPPVQEYAGGASRGRPRSAAWQKQGAWGPGGFVRCVGVAARAQPLSLSLDCSRRH